MTATRTDIALWRMELRGARFTLDELRAALASEDHHGTQEQMHNAIALYEQRVHELREKLGGVGALKMSPSSASATAALYRWHAQVLHQRVDEGRAINPAHSRREARRAEQWARELEREEVSA